MKGFLPESASSRRFAWSPQPSPAALPPMFSDRFCARIAVRAVRDIGGPRGVGRSRRVMSWTLRAMWGGIAMLGASTLANAQTARTGRALTIEDYYVIKTLGAPEISPDGRRVAYTISTRVEETNGARNEVWLVSADGSGAARRVSATGSNATAPTWTDNGALRFTLKRVNLLNCDAALPSVQLFI